MLYALVMIIWGTGASGGSASAISVDSSLRFSNLKACNEASAGIAAEMKSHPELHFMMRCENVLAANPK
jgi:hypothetical protein